MIKEEFNSYIYPFLKQIKNYKQILIWDNILMGLMDDCFMVIVDIIPTGIYGGYILDLQNEENPLVPYYPLQLKLKNMYDYYSMLLNTSPISNYTDMKEVDEFMHCINLKSKEGTDKFKIEDNESNDLLSLMNGTYLPITKSDSVSCAVRDVPYEPSQLWEYIIYKKKFKTTFHFLTKQLILR